MTLDELVRIERAHDLGSPLEHVLYKEVMRLREIVEQVHAWAVCACLAGPDDLFDNIEEIVKATDLDAPAEDDDEL